MQTNSQGRGYLMVAISSIGFGTLGLWGKWGYQAGFTPLSLLMVRFGIASTLLWICVLLRFRRFPWPGAKGALALAAQGGICYALTAACFFQALRLLPASLASMLFYLHPVFTTLLAGVLWRERIGKPQAIALLAAVVGTTLLAGQAVAGSISLAGCAFSLLAALAYSVFTLTGQSTKHLGSPLVTTAYSTTACFITITAWVRPSWSWVTNLTLEQWGIGLGIALPATVIGIMLFLAGVSVIGASQTAIVSALEPACGVLFALLFLGERLGGWQWLGILCILCGVGMLPVSHRLRRRQRTATRFVG